MERNTKFQKGDDVVVKVGRHAIDGSIVSVDKDDYGVVKLVDGRTFEFDLRRDVLARNLKQPTLPSQYLRKDNPRRRLPIPTPSNSRTRRIARASVDELDRNATYRVRGYPGIAFYTRGYVVEKKPIMFTDDEGRETGDWTGDYEEIEDRSRAVMVMVGDDRKHIVDIDDLTVLPEGEYCRGCGQIGCGHDTGV